jgi:hypothetical protein
MKGGGDRLLQKKCIKEKEKYGRWRGELIAWS